MLRLCTSFAAIFFAVLLRAQGSELVHLRSGFDLEARSHALVGLTYSLQMAAGTVEIPKDDVVAIETLVDTRPRPQPSAQPKTPDLLATIQTVSLSIANSPQFSCLVRCVAEVESALKQDAKSSKGATGVMQLMPDTAKELGVIASDTRENIRGGASYLRDLLTDYDGDAVLALAAYNAGPGAVKRYGGVPPYPETRLYIQKVLERYTRLQRTSPTMK